MVIILIAVALTAPGVSRLSAPTQARSPAAELVSAIARARDQAIRSRQAFVGTIDLRDGSWQDAQQNVLYALPDAFLVTSVVPDERKRIPCVFMPDGHGCKLSIRLQGMEEAWQIRVDPVTGRTTLFREKNVGDADSVGGVADQS